jgi:hypothetical protein
MDIALEFLRFFLIGMWYTGPPIGLLVLVIVILGRPIGIREGWSRADSAYHASITTTTVGYGDFHPKKGLSKTLGIAISFVGIILSRYCRCACSPRCCVRIQDLAGIPTDNRQGGAGAQGIRITCWNVRYATKQPFVNS